MACYDFDYTIQMLRQAIAFAEEERNFGPLRKWANEVEQSGQQMEAMNVRLNLFSSQDFILAILKAVADSSIPPDEANRHIRRWLNNGEMQQFEADPVKEYEFA